MADYLKLLGYGYLFLATAVITYLKENNFRLEDYNPLESMIDQVWNK